MYFLNKNVTKYAVCKCQHEIKLFLINLREQVKDGVFSEKDKLTLYVVDSMGKMYFVKSEKLYRNTLMTILNMNRECKST